MGWEPGLSKDERRRTKADAAAEAMWADDRASRALGMAIERVEPGRAVLSMIVRSDMLNGHGTCHGGYLFLLADSAFAFACNSHNAHSVAQHAAIDFLAPGREGDRLVATAEERSLRGRSGVYDVTVENDDGPVAMFRGLSRTVPGFHRPDLEEPNA